MGVDAQSGTQGLSAGAVGAILLASIAVMTTLELVCHWYWRRRGWAVKDRMLVVACIVAAVHSSSAIVASGVVLVSERFDLDGPNTWLQEAILVASAGYFCVDTVACLLYELDGKYSYIAHHVVCAVYELSTVWTGHAAFSCVFMLFFGELTSPVLNTKLIVDELVRVEHREVMVRLQARCAKPVAVIFLLVRGGVAHSVSLWLAWFFLFGEVNEHVPRGWQIYYALLCVLVPVATLPFVALLWRVAFKPSPTPHAKRS